MFDYDVLESLEVAAGTTGPNRQAAGRDDEACTDSSHSAKPSRRTPQDDRLFDYDLLEEACVHADEALPRELDVASLPANKVHELGAAAYVQMLLDLRKEAVGGSTYMLAMQKLLVKRPAADQYDSHRVTFAALATQLLMENYHSLKTGNDWSIAVGELFQRLEMHVCAATIGLQSVFDWPSEKGVLGDVGASTAKRRAGQLPRGMARTTRPLWQGPGAPGWARTWTRRSGALAVAGASCSSWACPWRCTCGTRRTSTCSWRGTASCAA